MVESICSIAARRPFSHSPSRNLPPLTEWKLMEGHQQLHGNLQGDVSGDAVSRVDDLAHRRHDPHPDLYDRLREVLIDLGSPPIEESFLVFFMDLLREAGFLPSFSRASSAAN